MIRNVFALIAAVMMLTLGSVAQARNDNSIGRWDEIGSAKVSLGNERDSIRVNSRTPYSKLRFSVHDRAVEFDRVFVEFGSGQRVEVPVRQRIRAGGQTRVIDLPGKARYIKKIVFYYKTAPGSLKRAKVAVWARR